MQKSSFLNDFLCFLLVFICCVAFFVKHPKVYYINKNIAKNNIGNIFDLKSYKNTLTKEYVINDFVKNSTIDTTISYDFLELIEYGNNYKYGIIVNKTNLRFLPTNEPFYKDNDEDFDYLQNSEIKFNEPLLILFEYNDWYFVQAYNMIGWVNKSDIALFKSKKQFLNYINNKKFLVVIDKAININNIYADMGVKINYIKKSKKSYCITIPKRDINGYIYFENINIDKDGLNIGYLKYDKNNVIGQAFKYLGTKYGWGGVNNGIDCSGFILNIYNSFGIKLPRDSINQQKSTGKYVDIPTEITYDKRLNILKKTETGSLLYFRGHIMLYLGFIGKKPYIVHSIASYKNNNTMSVIVSDLDITRKNETTFIDSISSITWF